MKNTRLLQEGDIIEIKAGHTIRAHVPCHFVLPDMRGCFQFTTELVKVEGELEYLAGKYVVCKTTFDGGGDGFSNGHRIFCESLKNGTSIDFYQTGDFKNTIGAIEPIGKAVKQWILLSQHETETDHPRTN